MVVSLLRFMVSPEKTAQDLHPSHPGHLLSHSSSTLLLPYTHVPASSPGTDSHMILDNHPIFDQLLDLQIGVGFGDFIGLIGVQPDLFTTAEDTRVKPVL